MPSLNDDASREEIFEFFPMLEGMSEDELNMLKEDCDYPGNDEDKPLVHAIDTLLKRMGEDDEENEPVPA